MAAASEIYLSFFLVYRVNWLWMRALWDRWKEEVQLLKCKQEWTKNFFENKVRFWTGRKAAMLEKGQAGLACYARCMAD
ncbi:hypothetical protein F5J12DRAFT_724287 [Pisolithus orientalis]|uniref:uncharacterized protein n=1 Tax=Pisolithus orientalis TaxID=936130 RepID=UPI002225B452|nr:uncharacterized protein F5J12DRAFT_724287 [Pisolithus orientalis]KAI5999775.1 hypothetical protein F5J12DRAFT_724287 [Pisolithus orientalis]